MRSIHKFLALIVTAIVLVIFFIIFALKIATISESGISQKYKSQSIQETVKVYKNQNGIPHIIAANEKDAIYMAGFTHAADRLWQMEYSRRKAYGRLAEVLGPDAVPADKLFRILNLKRTSYNVLKTMNKHTKDLLQSYSDGVNFYITSQKKKLPFEFGALGYYPEEWQPVDCIMIQRLQAFEFSNSFWADLAFGEIAAKLNVYKAKELLPSYPNDAPHVFDAMQPVQKDSQLQINISLKPYREDLQTTEKTLLAIKDYIGLSGSVNGCNSWAVRNKKNHAILANDCHSSPEMPSRWYQMHISCPDYNAAGLTIPGIPFIFSGRNDNISWGVTNMMLDDFDYFIEKIDSTDQNSYYSGDKKLKFKYVSDTIKVKGSRDQIYYIRQTNRSSVISDIDLPAYKSISMKADMPVNGNKFLQSNCLTFSWTGNEPTDEMTSLYRINKSQNFAQFKIGASGWGSPAMVFTYSDKNGNIAATAFGSMPQREKNCNSWLPNFGWESEASWSGISKSNEIGSTFNPENGRIIAANNALDKNNSRFITNYWEPSSRADRIELLLNSFQDYSARDAQKIQNDFQSPYAQKLLQKVMPVLTYKHQYFTDLEKTLYWVLSNWDYTLSQHLPAPLIYSSFMQHLVRNLISDEIGEEIFNDYSTVTNLPLRKALELMNTDSSAWFDDIRTQKIENRDEIIFRSFRDATNELSAEFGDQVMDWKYGNLHEFTLRHAFDGKSFFKPAVSLKSMGIGGDITTINNTEWKFLKPYQTTTIVSMRMIADMSDSVIYTIIPGGSSGQTLSGNYSDQVQLWLNGGYIEMNMSPKPGEEYKLWVTIEPGK